ncbi:MAG: hypothetical protein H0W45_09370 [Acidobacteria bacterium]|jgi:hypothetical protein|nr:hypothetical protein [Acidobacteriota bacterium]
MFFADERDSDKVAFSPDSEKGQPNVFSFEDETYKTGTFYPAFWKINETSLTLDNL